MHLIKKNNMIHTLLHNCNKDTPTETFICPPPPVVKKRSTRTLDSSYHSTHHSIKSFAKGVITSIADSGVSVSRSGSIVHSDHPSLGNYYQKKLVPLLNEEEDEALGRIVSQNYILRTAFDDLDFSAPVDTLLQQNDTVVLDVGCGSGTWTMELATQYPKAHFIGIDKAPLYPQHIKPKNCQFKQFEITSAIGDYNRLPFDDASVDFIFQRDMNWGLSESAWLPLVAEFYRILKPGGWIELVEPDIETHSGSNAHEAFFMSKLVSALHHRQQDPFISKRLSSFMATAGFRRIQSEFKSMPLGWGYQKLFHAKKQRTTSRCSEFARAAANHRLDLFRSLQPWFCRENNMSKAKFDSFLDLLPDDWHHSRAYTNWHRSTAQKPY